MRFVRRRFVAVGKIKINPTKNREIQINSGHLEYGGALMFSEKEGDFSEQIEATLIKQAQAGSQESLNLLLLRHA
jgi:hypothetical protein